LGLRHPARRTRRGLTTSLTYDGTLDRIHHALYGGYQGERFQNGLKRVCGQINIEIVKRSDAGKFVVLPKRWIVARTIAWLNRCRRLAKDWECLNRSGLAFLRWASIRLMVRKLCQKTI
jgi:transposase